MSKALDDAESTVLDNKTPSRSWGICRSSSIKQIESCSTQRQMIAETCQRLALPEPAILEEPQATSGKIPFAKRPQGSYLLRVLTKGDVLVVVRVDRLGRSMTDIFNTVEVLCGRGVRVLIIRGWGGQSVDLGRATDRLFLMILAWCAETERNLTAERTRDGLQFRRDNKLSAGKRFCTFIQAFSPDGQEIPAASFDKKKGHYKVNLPDKAWLDQLCELLMLQRAIQARGRVLFDYCAEKHFVNRAGKEWWRGTVHCNGSGTYTNQIGKALKKIRPLKHQ